MQIITLLCITVGLSDRLRQDTHVMKALRVHTSQSPAIRIQRLNELRRQIHEYVTTL